MRTSARPRTLVLVVSDLVIDVAMLGPQGHEVGARQVVPLTTETATLWSAIEQLGEFDRITVVGTDPHGIGNKLARQSQRPLRHMTAAELDWKRVIAGEGVELALTIGPPMRSALFHDGAVVPGLDLGSLRVRKERRLREYLTPRVLERKGPEAWLRRVTRAIDEIGTIWSAGRLYIAAPPSLPMPESSERVIFVHARTSVADAMTVWEPQMSASDASLQISR